MTRNIKIAFALVFAAGAVYASTQLVGGFNVADQPGKQFHIVRPETLSTSLVERGKLESQANVRVVSQVEDVSGDGIRGNAIISIIENGSMVKKGDLLVVIDSGTHVERVDNQILETDQAEARQLEAEVQYKNQISKNETLAAAAELNVRLAELELKMFEDPEKGTHRLAVDAINRLIDDTENQILAAKASLQLSANELQGLATLFKYGYVGKNELERVKLDYLQAQSTVAARTNRLKTQIATVEKMNVFEREMQLLTLTGALQTAKRTQQQVKLDNDANLEAAQTELDRANRVLAKERELLARYRTQLEACKIHAPQDGMVSYAVPRHSREAKIELGAVVWEGQTILYLPDLSRMQVSTVVHETVRSWVRPGLPVTVRLESMPENSYEGTVARVDLMPDRRNWDESDTKVYKTLVTIDELVHGELKPGMTAIVEIHLEDIHDALTVPVSAIVYEAGSTYCHVRKGGLLERVEVKLGRSDEHRVQIVEGLSAGDEVALPSTDSES